MRSPAADFSRLVVFSASVADAAGGGGFLQPGSVPFAFQRTSTGNYQINFDPRISPIRAAGMVISGRYMSVTALSSGSISFLRAISTTNAGENGDIAFFITAWDGRY